MPSYVPTEADLQTEYLDGDMSPSELVAILKALPFPKGKRQGRPPGPSHCIVSLDCDARDYIVGAVMARHGSK
jgi:hypothetical protein